MPVAASVAPTLRPIWPRLADAGHDDAAFGGQNEIDCLFEGIIQRRSQKAQRLRFLQYHGATGLDDVALDR